MTLALPENLRWPKSVCLRITRACNARCAFCQAPDLHDDKSWNADEVKRVARMLADAGIASVKLSGGEPTIRNDLAAIIEAVAGEGISVTVISNGIRISDEVLQALGACGGKLKFSVHYGDERNDQVLGNRSFARVTGNAARATALAIPLGFNSVVFRENVTSMSSVAALAAKLGARKVSYFPVVARGAASSNFEDELHEGFRRLVREEADRVRTQFPDLKIRVIDIADEEYWIIDHDGSLFVSGGKEDQDRIIFNDKRWIYDRE